MLWLKLKINTTLSKWVLREIILNIQPFLNNVSEEENHNLTIKKMSNNNKKLSKRESDLKEVTRANRRKPKNILEPPMMICLSTT